MRIDASGRTFEPIRLLGAGGFGEVYLARMQSPGGLARAVAVKLLRPGLDPESQAVERLRDEARLLVSLRHPVLLAADDLVVLDGRVALVTEYIDGQDLSAILRDPADPIPPSALLEVVEAVASALDAAWNQLRVVHRDIKPHNIRIGVHGNVKLLDFGIARSSIAVRSAHTAEQSVLGTAEYLAPERYETELEPTPASDVFSLGCVLFEGLTGSRLFAGMGLTRILAVVVPPVAWREFVDERLATCLTEPMRSLVAGMLSHDPAARPTAAEVAQRCEALVLGWDGAVPLRRWCRDRQWPEEEQTRLPPPLTGGGEADDDLPLLDLEPDGDDPSDDVSRSGVSHRVPSAIPERAPWLGWARWAAVAVTFAGSFVLAGAAMLGAAVIAQLVPEPAGVEAPPVLAPIRTAPVEEVVEEEVAAPPEPAPAPAPAVEAPAPPSKRPPPRPRPRPAAPAPVAAPVPAPTPVASTPSPAPAPEAVPTIEITIGSRPTLGARVVDLRTGKELGTTLLVRAFPLGDHDIALVAPSGEQTRYRLAVRRDAPTRYIWNITDGRLEAGQ